ncbi:succinate dehydrogenase, cytochrome b556 subunit [Bradyrhizobium pachyrhizi]|uniref:Succinate dehydrogenase cytochrome b556 subunit n=1 Tax=Bradyrhizobium pachyrhizi TaxID=280333 RepID=A0A844SGK5_9BRAD|nr:succinate dehydrogenase, cytochrome b556 subunit [Bradyrhizobium pachyrhizi]MVT64887.1 succinate dehydrogenase, cytochrome b556 subunit [Bradyrhizobium pachyrhizi]
MPREPARRQRPQSPNIQIYRPQLTSVLSIANRISGVVITIGAVGLVLWLLAAAAGPDAYAYARGLLSSSLGQCGLLVLLFAFFFHLCSGIRHLVWDAGYGFNLSAIYESGWTSVVASIVLTGGTWIAIQLTGS